MAKGTVWYKHRGVRHNKKQLHQHPSHPYLHPSGRWHLHPPTSRIRDRKGKAFRHTPQERRHVHVKGYYRERTGQRRRWD